VLLSLTVLASVTVSNWLSLAAFATAQRPTPR
jgi:hypothetical protein